MLMSSQPWPRTVQQHANICHKQEAMVKNRPQIIIGKHLIGPRAPAAQERERERERERELRREGGKSLQTNKQNVKVPPCISLRPNIFQTPDPGHPASLPASTAH